MSGVAKYGLLQFSLDGLPPTKFTLNIVVVGPVVHWLSETALLVEIESQRVA